MSLLAFLSIVFLSILFVALVHDVRGGAGAAQWTNIIQAVATSSGIMVAGYLYFIERRAQPHADVVQTVQIIGIGDRRVLIEASVSVKNLGGQLLKISHLRSSLQVVDLEMLGTPSLSSLNNPAYWTSDSTVAGTKGKAFDETEIVWPQVRLFDGPVNHEIEPGESDPLTVDFVIQCPESRYVRVASDVQKLASNSAGEKSPGMVWKTRTLVDLRPVCGKGR